MRTAYWLIIARTASVAVLSAVAIAIAGHGNASALTIAMTATTSFALIELVEAVTRLSRRRERHSLFENALNSATALITKDIAVGQVSMSLWRRTIKRGFSRVITTGAQSETLPTYLPAGAGIVGKAAQTGNVVWVKRQKGADTGFEERWQLSPSTLSETRVLETLVSVPIFLTPDGDVREVLTLEIWSKGPDDSTVETAFEAKQSRVFDILRDTANLLSALRAV
jgi:hypothetical protein